MWTLLSNLVSNGHVTSIVNKCFSFIKVEVKMVIEMVCQHKSKVKVMAGGTGIPDF